MNIISNQVSSDKLRGFVERLENIAQRKADCSADEKVIVAEAQAEGFSSKALRAALKVRKMKPSDFQEGRALLDTYLTALGMQEEPPLFRAMGLVGVDTTMRESVIEAMKRFVPTGGSITVESEGRPFKLIRQPDGTVSVTEVVERPAPSAQPASAGKASSDRAAPPDVDSEGAERLGVEAGRNDQPVISNPFPFGDQRRPRWDKGWRIGAGSDGMGPDD